MTAARGAWGYVRNILIIIALTVSSEISPDVARGADDKALGLFQLVSRADLIVHVKTREGALRYARVDVLETIKGEAPAPRLRIAFREFNLGRGPGEDPIVFPDGQEEILLLSAHPLQERKEKHRDLYELCRGREGRFTVPAEGREIFMNAVRKLARLAGADPVTQIEELAGLLASDNHYLLTAALEELHRLRAGAPEHLPRLVPLIHRPSETVRIWSLRLVGQAFGSRRVDDPSRELGPDPERAALTAVMERARNDPEDEVRLEAVSTMAAWPNRSEIEAELRAIAAQDPNQMVRYEAERALFRLVRSAD